MQGIYTYTPAAGTVSGRGQQSDARRCPSRPPTFWTTQGYGDGLIKVAQHASTETLTASTARGRTGPDHHLHGNRVWWATAALLADRLGAVPDQRRERRLARAPDRKRHGDLLNDRAGVRFLHRHRSLFRRCELHRYYVTGPFRNRSKSGRLRRRHHTLRRRCKHYQRLRPDQPVWIHAGRQYRTGCRRHAQPGQHQQVFLPELSPPSISTATAATTTSSLPRL